MRSFIGLFIVLIFSSYKIMAQTNYDNNWKKVSALEEKGLPKSALEEVNKIYAQAVKDKAEAQQIKALIFRLKYNSQISDSSTLQNLETINGNIAAAKGPARAILQTIRAEMLYGYLQQNRYKFYNRTAISHEEGNDITSWSLDRLTKEITAAYQASLADKTLLEKTDIAVFDPILIKGQHTRPLRNTLFDLLAHRALDYFQSGEERLTKPANQFELDDAAAFAPAAAFAAHTFKTTDATSLQYQAVLLLQQLLRLHENDKAAQLDVDMKRLDYMNQMAVVDNKDELYRQALEQMTKDYKGLPEVSSVMHQLASWHYRNGQTERTDSAGNIKKAKAICEDAMKQFPHTNGASSCAYLLDQINAPFLELSTEQVNVPGLPFRTLVNYKNISKIYLRAVAIDEAFLKQLRKARNNYQEAENAYWKLITSRPAAKHWEQPLPDPKDYTSHRAEIKIDALPLGQYMIVASTQPAFALKDNPMALQFTWISNISYMESGTSYYVLDRTTGKPLANVQAGVWRNTGSYDGDNWKLYKTLSTARDGRVEFDSAIAKGSNYNTIRIKWELKNDLLFLDDTKYIYHNQPAEKTVIKPELFLFTDRSIYRPGQTIWFKGIVVKRKQEQSVSDIVSGYKTTIQLLDANREKVDSLTLQTNEYGSFSGKFVIPEGRMNGYFKLETKEGIGGLAVHVEEYKRPKFFVEFDTVKNSYRLGETVTANGKALAYAGNNINGAIVKYRVERKVRFPYPWMFGRYVPTGTSREIAHGETTTDAGGHFEIKFPALPDRSLDPATLPVFSYVVHADITDLNGETRSAEQWIQAGYQTMEISIQLASRVVAKDLSALNIFTKNLNGAYEKATVNLQLLPLQPTSRLLRERYWEQPDQFVMTEAAFVQAFPSDIYKDEDKPASWQRKAAAIQQSFVTAPDGKVTLDSKKLAPGYYELVATAKDRNGKEVIQKTVFELIDTDAKTLAAPAYLWQFQPEPRREPGQKATVLLGTSAKDVHVIQSLQSVQQPERITTMNLSGLNRLEYPVTEQDRGGLLATYVFVKDNRFYATEEYINVPWDNKTLAVKTATHRDKLLPGEKEKWTVEIAGNKGEKVAAELLASMYDASLDAFAPHQWSAPYLYPSVSNSRRFSAYDNFRQVTSQYFFESTVSKDYPIADRSYDALNFFDWNMNDERSRLIMRELNALGGSSKDKPAAMYKRSRSEAIAEIAAPAPAAVAEDAAGKGVAQQENKPAEQQTENTNGNISIRKNFQETAFFLPDLRTDKNGNVSFEFTMPEALTKWNFQGLAHTKDLAFGYVNASIVTQKSLMVQPNAPRFIREGDKIDFTAKVSNLTDTLLIGQAHLELLDAATMQPVDGWFQNIFPTQHFTARAGESTVVTFQLQAPHGFNSALLYRVTAQAGNFSDGEENAIPVLTNSMLVTESLPLPVRGDGKHTFTFDKLLHSDSSSTLRQQAVTVEYTSNPAWYAVQALPYLMEYPYDCAEQVFNRYYANALATHITAVTPGIKAIFERWKNTDTAALLSNLQKNEELKAVLLQQTPWVLEAKNEEQQKKNIALLFDLQRMQRERKTALDQLAAKQQPDGSFSWFNGMWADRFITQYIVAGIGHLRKLTGKEDPVAEAIAAKAMAWLDRQLDKDYYDLIKHKADLKKQQIGYLQVHYLYARSFFSSDIAPAMQKSFDYFLEQEKQYWPKLGKYAQGMSALTLSRKNDKVTPTAILKSLKENSINNPEMGMYWKDLTGGYNWHEAPIETQALLIEAFEEGNDKTAVADMKTWLLKNKQTNNWHTTKATADACYAMLLNGSNWLAAAPQVTIRLGETTVSSSTQPTEAGTGYFKERIDGKAVKADMGNITVTVDGSKGQPSWGAVYWQYFENLDKISAAKTPLVLEKELYKEVNTDKGAELTKITEGNELKVGDKVKVRIVLRADRTMEYIHLRDMRAACFEPLNVISASKWQGGLSYYESTKDASTDFFFSYLPKGTYVFEYVLFVTHQGKFSNGISTAQCMYAPEFSAHSEGLSVKVVEK
ncbi:alpha-2-macroglobulin [Chitinophaga sp. Mgbs1]|uniref:Alpha-2-macroglobulin n=1 Tax=Chitinophaga solisilvae TaxID=1233460 RepID=A0A3S1CZ96_9BACT|nr:alpha-2-macroglobulin [Chitinophaga solisilvae]